MCKTIEIKIDLCSYFGNDNISRVTLFTSFPIKFCFNVTCFV